MKDPDTRLQEGQYEITVPTIADRIAQTVVTMVLEPTMEPVFHGMVTVWVNLRWTRWRCANNAVGDIRG
jgi:hypothetical protein